jgi:spore germination protein YaaH
MKFMTWTLHAPAKSEFNKFVKLRDGAKWYENKYDVVDPNGLEKFTDYRKRSFMEMIIKYPEKFYAIGCHNLGVDSAGNIYGTPTVDETTTSDWLCLNSDQTDIVNPIPESLRWLMWQYPDIKWSLQYLCTQDRVNGVLWSTSAQNNFISQMYKITKLHKDNGLPIKGVEIDFERTNSSFAYKDDDHITFKNLLVRIKNEVCIPLGMELRVNLFAMTGAFTPSYYKWHDYGTLASGLDMNGNQAIDEFQLMSYDFSYGGSAPGPSTPLNWLASILTHVNNVLPPEKTFIGNAGYGRRWFLGEDKLGVTLDYKQLMAVQNGMYVHNDGNQDANGKFWFHDQDFHPVCGFNDVASDYQRTYFNVYDRFNILPNGGSIAINDIGTDDNTVAINMTDQYATVYSGRQFPKFGGIVATAKQPTSIGSVNAKYTGDKSPARSEDFLGQMFKGYRLEKASTDPITGAVTVPSGSVTYDVNVPSAGNYHVVAFISLPFFGKAKQPITVNGTSYLINGDTGTYPYLQSNHFHDCGVFALNAGTNTIRATAPTDDQYNTGPIVYGFVVCQTFDYNYRGGSIDFPSYCEPLLKRDDPANVVNGVVPKVEAKYPDQFRIVGEILRRTPRPQIIWEDRFGTYYLNNSELAGTDYYPLDGAGGSSIGSWKAINEYVDANGKRVYGHALGLADNTPSQLMLGYRFTGNMVVTAEVQGMSAKPVYGIRITDKTSTDGYLAYIDFFNETIRLLKNGVDVITPKTMTVDMKQLENDRVALYLYVLNGKLSFYINKTNYFDRIPITLDNVDGGYYGVYANKCQLRLFNYNISSLDRWERMEKVGVEVDGVMYEYGDVPRSTTPIDQYGFLMYSGYPYEIVGKVGIANTVVSTEDAYIALADKSKYNEIDTDYKNVALKVMPYSWRGAKNIRFHFLNAGVWLKTLYVGDHEGMSVAYNSDRIGFVKTANMVLDAKCKGIAMWTLGQEDPTVFTYLPNKKE